MPDPFEQQVQRTIQGHRMLKTGNRVLAAVSGGADSTALLLALKALQPTLGLVLTAAHVNHRLRGEASDADQTFVEELCRELGIPLRLVQLETPHEEPAGNREDRLRIARYEFLAAAAHRGGAVVATGHTLNDQAETLLIKLFRGSGTAGLSGVFPSRTHRLRMGGVEQMVPVIRPLIEISRPQVEAYLERRKQPYRLDASNLDRSLDRNWVRYELVPLLESRLNPRVIRVLGRTAGFFRDLESYLRSEAAGRLNACLEGSPDRLELKIDALRKLPSALRRQLVREVIRLHRGHLQGLTLGHVDAVLSLLNRASGRSVSLPGKMTVVREFEVLKFGAASPPVPVIEYELSVPGSVHIEEFGRVLRARQGESRRSAGGIFLRETGSRLIVRNRRPGDRYRTSLEGPPRKLKKLLIEKRVPVSRRDRLLVLARGEDLVWVEGFPPNPAFAASPEDAEAIEIELTDETFRA